MKEKCDNNCATCPMQTQMHCVLVYSKANNASIAAMMERIQAIESRMSIEQPMLLNPIDSVKLPTLEEEETINAKVL